MRRAPCRTGAGRKHASKAASLCCSQVLLLVLLLGLLLLSVLLPLLLLLLLHVQRLLQMHPAEGSAQRVLAPSACPEAALAGCCGSGAAKPHLVDVGGRQGWRGQRRQLLSWPLCPSPSDGGYSTASLSPAIAVSVKQWAGRPRCSSRCAATAGCDRSYILCAGEHAPAERIAGQPVGRSWSAVAGMAAGPRSTSETGWRVRRRQRGAAWGHEPILCGEAAAIAAGAMRAGSPPAT